MKIKWYCNRDFKTGEYVYWTQRDAKGVCFEIRTSYGKPCRLYVCEEFHGQFAELSVAQKIAENMWEA